MTGNSPRTDVAVLREMVRLAELRRKEELEHIERVNRYNLAIIAFDGSFLSLIITTQAPGILWIGGFLVLISIGFALEALRPRTVQASIVVDSDVQAIRKGYTFTLDEYLLETAALFDQAASALTHLSRQKKRWTIYSATFLAIALGISYILYIMPKLGSTTVGL